VSDQDFFFDEDEQPTGKAAEKPAKPGGKSSAAKTVPAKGGKPAPAQASGGIELTWTITALIGVVALLVGVIIGLAIPNNSAVDTTGSSGIQQTAPQLTPEEMQSGQLPAGHPDISGMASGTASATTTP